MILKSVLLGVVTAGMGGMIAFAYLIDDVPKTLSPKDVAEMKAAAAEDGEDEVGGPTLVYILPKRDSGGGQYLPKRDALINGTLSELVITEAEINAWLRANFSPQSQEDDEGGIVTLKPEVPQVALTQGEVQVVMYLDSQAMDRRARLAVVGRGTFVQKGNNWKFAYHHLSVSQGRIPFIGGVIAQAFGAVFQKAPEGEALSEVWDEISSIEVHEGELWIQL
ncbi:MAG: nuclear transport factor 2 family protein [Opitutales bacterium]|nr:nuclear transport factor 2 family protein [Opitutales bacterium]NRA26408.1 hypothetical protein [Opitutales bacterium]